MKSIPAKQTNWLQRYRLVLGAFILALVLSGITAFPLQLELDVLVRIRGYDSVSDASGE